MPSKFELAQTQPIKKPSNKDDSLKEALTNEQRGLYNKAEEKIAEYTKEKKVIKESIRDFLKKDMLSGTEEIGLDVQMSRLVTLLRDTAHWIKVKYKQPHAVSDESEKEQAYAVRITENMKKFDSWRKDVAKVVDSGELSITDFKKKIRKLLDEYESLDDALKTFN